MRLSSSGSRRSARARWLLAIPAAAALWAANLAFSVSCVPRTPCVSLASLIDGASLPEAIHVLDRHGRPLADVEGPLRQALPDDSIPPLVANAFVAVEDRRFWSHGGVDGKGILRALAHNVAVGSIKEGASTIPMQLVRTLWGESLRDVGPWRRKVIEARTAPFLVKKLGHRKVLALYLNAIYMGHGLYGVEAAARYYFGVGAEALDLSQVATLVGITRSPETLDPVRHPDRARARRDVVLEVLATTGVVTREDAERAKILDLSTVEPQRGLFARSHLTAAVVRELRAVAPELTGRPGVRVETTIDPAVQSAAEGSLTETLDRIERGTYGRYRADDDVLEGAAVALDPRTGAVRAWVGGRDFGRSEFDRVSQARRQVGSLVKPLLVAAALEDGMDILDLVSASSVPLDVPGPVDWVPADHVDDPILPMREALIRSSNRAAVSLGRAVGVGRLRSVGRDAGISSPIPDVPSAFIGSFEASLLEMVRAYAVFGNGGARIEPHLVQRVLDADGIELWRRAPSASPPGVMTEITSFVVLDALRAVVDRGTGVSVRTVGYAGEAAGKTGTTNGGRDAWFVGLVPDLVAGVWIGFDRPRGIVAGANGGTLAGGTWGRWMARVDRALGSPRGAWVAPPGLIPIRYDPVTGDAAAVTCDPGPGQWFVEAWAPAARYSDRGCSSVLERLLRRFWHSLVPRRPAIIGEVRNP